MNEITNAVVTIAVAIVGVALLATLVSRNANTAGVFQAGGAAFAQALSAATGPVTGNSPAMPFGGVQGFGGQGFALPGLYG